MDLCGIVLTFGQAVGIGKAWILSIGYGLNLDFPVSVWTPAIG